MCRQQKTQETWVLIWSFFISDTGGWYRSFCRRCLISAPMNTAAPSKTGWNSRCGFCARCGKRWDRISRSRCGSPPMNICREASVLRMCWPLWRRRRNISTWCRCPAGWISSTRQMCIPRLPISPSMDWMWNMQKWSKKMWIFSCPLWERSWIPMRRKRF